MSFFDRVAGVIERNGDKSSAVWHDLVTSKIFEIERRRDLTANITAKDMLWLNDSFMLPFKKVLVDEHSVGKHGSLEQSDSFAHLSKEELKAIRREQPLIEQLVILSDAEISEVRGKNQPIVGLSQPRRFTYVAPFSRHLMLLRADHMVREMGLGIVEECRNMADSLTDDIWGSPSGRLRTNKSKFSHSLFNTMIVVCGVCWFEDLDILIKGIQNWDRDGLAALNASLRCIVDECEVVRHDGLTMGVDWVYGDFTMWMGLPRSATEFLRNSFAINMLWSYVDMIKMNMPKNFVLGRIPNHYDKARKRSQKTGRILRTPDRPSYTILIPEEIRRRMRSKREAKEHQGGTVRCRRSHWRYLWDDRFVNKQHEWVPVKAVWPDEVESIVGKHRYKVYLSYNHDWPGFKPTDPPKRRKKPA